uniref:Uncharacterized protein n=1 Tax=Arion vulgaris TaxID=1028688 RepID=A0A0B7ANH6_9EUPU
MQLYSGRLLIKINREHNSSIVPSSNKDMIPSTLNILVDPCCQWQIFRGNRKGGGLEILMPKIMKINLYCF